MRSHREVREERDGQEVAQLGHASEQRRVATRIFTYFIFINLRKSVVVMLQ